MPRGLATLTNDLSGTANDLSVTFTYNPAAQMVSSVRTGDTYAWTGHGNGTTAYVSNGLNQQTSIGGSAASWDSKGNLTADPTSGRSYTYWPSTNQQWTVSSPWTAMSYDPLDRLAVIDSATDTKFAYDGVESIAEYDGSNVLQRRFVFGPGIDQPIVQYDGSGTSNRSFMGTDERGSVISLTDSSGTLLNLNRYDEYGKPQSTNTGRFQYTGQRWLSEAGLYDYKARAYVPHLGIFGQTDPIGYADSANLYPYVLGDPINLIDPLGLMSQAECEELKKKAPGPVICADRLSASAGIQRSYRIVVTGRRIHRGRRAMIVGITPPDKLKTCEVVWLRSKLSGFGLNLSGLNEITFYAGLGPSGFLNPFIFIAYGRTTTGAVTQGKSVWVKPAEFESYTTPGDAGRYEEVLHSVQFETVGPAAFYAAYGAGWVAAGGSYEKNPLESSAKSLSQSLADNFVRERPCG